ncbi:MAG: leucine-rich repeat domain-containing protein [Leptospiraceae bacterium]
MPAKKLSVESLEKQWNVTLPERLKEFFSSGEWKEYEGKSASNLYGFSSDVKAQISFSDRSELKDKYEYSEEMLVRKSFWPLCDIVNLDGSFYMAVDLNQKKLPVLFFDYESGFQNHSKSLEEFLGSLLAADEKTKAELVKELHANARKLYDADKYSECIQIIEKGLSELGEMSFDILDHFKDLPSALLNLKALCFKNLKDYEKAIPIFEQAAADGQKHAALNLMGIYLEQMDYKKLVEYADYIVPKLLMLWDDYCAYFSFLYRGLAYSHLDNRKEATKYFGFIATRYIDNSERMEQAIRRLKEEKEDSKNTEIFELILSWMDREVPEPSPERSRELLDWWKALSTELKEGLSELIDKNAKKVTALDLELMLRRTELDLSISEAGDLSWIKPFQRLRTLSLENCNISDLSPLNSPWLKKLKLGGNPLKNLATIAQFKHMEDLDLSDTGISDLSPLSALTNLRELKLDDNKIQSVAPLASLKELKELDIYDNRITDLNPLKDNLMLKEISCFSNPLEEIGFSSVEDLRHLPLLKEIEPHWDEDPSQKDMEKWHEARPWELPLSDGEYQDWWQWWTSLSPEWKQALEGEIDEMDGEVPTAESFQELRSEGHFSLSRKDLKDLEPLKRLIRADWVSVRKNGIEVIPDLSSLGCLRSLSLEENSIKDLAPLQKIPYLAYVDLSNNALEGELDLPALAYLRNLDLNHNKLTGIKCISAQQGLRRLELIDNEIEDVSPIAELTELRELFIQQNKITDISALAKCDNLEELVVFGNPDMTGLLALKDLPYLYKVRAHGAFSQEEADEFRQMRPDVDLL